MSKQVLMNAMDTKRMLAMLYPDIKVAEVDTKVEEDPHAMFGTFISDEDEPVSLCAFDRAFAGYLGAALTMVPQETATAAAESGEYSDIIKANVGEVLNILSRIYMEGSSPHLRQAATRWSASELTPAEQAIIDNCAARLDMKMEIPGYGAGCCSLITL